MPQAWQTCVWPIPLKLHQVGWEMSVHRQISDFSRDVQMDSSLGSGWATQGQSQDIKTNPLISWLCLSCWKMNCCPSQRSKWRRAAVCLSGQSTRQAWFVACCKDGFPSGMFSSVSTEEPWCSDRVAIRFLVTSLPFSPIAQIRWSASSQKTVLLVLNFFQICASKQSSIRGRQIILTSCLVFILTYTVNFGNVKKGVCLSKSYPINWLYHKWTPNKLQKHRNRWKQDAPFFYYYYYLIIRL